jgi:hypothetical protein
MKDNLKRLSFDLPEELLGTIGNEMKPERALNQFSVVYTPKHPELMPTLIGTALEEGYKRMGRINLGMAEMGLGGDVCCLQDYEENLRDDADDTEY